MPSGWRAWTVTPAGELLSPYARLGADPRYSTPWPAPPAPMRAWCKQHRRPPIPACECGIRASKTAAGALNAAVAGHLLDPGDLTRPPGLASLLVVVAVGQVELGGVVLGGAASDPPRTLRASRASVTGTLYLSSNGADRSAALATRYGLRVEPLSSLVA